MWWHVHEWFLPDTRCDTLSHNVMCAQGKTCREKVSCEVYLSTDDEELRSTSSYATASSWKQATASTLHPEKWTNSKLAQGTRTHAVTRSGMERQHVGNMKSQLKLGACADVEIAMADLKWQSAETDSREVRLPERKIILFWGSWYTWHVQKSLKHATNTFQYYRWPVRELLCFQQKKKSQQECEQHTSRSAVWCNHNVMSGRRTDAHRQRTAPESQWDVEDLPMTYVDCLLDRLTKSGEQILHLTGMDRNRGYGTSLGTKQNPDSGCLRLNDWEVWDMVLITLLLTGDARPPLRWRPASPAHDDKDQTAPGPIASPPDASHAVHFCLWPPMVESPKPTTTTTSEKEKEKKEEKKQQQLLN